MTARITGWWFYSGVVAGAPAVWLIGGFYVATSPAVGAPSRWRRPRR
ncbi:MAG TPA: hypothetical protein VF087_07480 [Solirubrobacteraceae bacterium]